MAAAPTPFRTASQPLRSPEQGATGAADRVPAPSATAPSGAAVPGAATATSQPAKGRRKKLVMVGAMVPPEQKARVEELARQRGQSVSKYLMDRALGVRPRRATKQDVLQDMCVELNNLTVQAMALAELARVQGAGNVALNEMIERNRSVLDRLMDVAFEMGGDEGARDEDEAEGEAGE